MHVAGDALLVQFAAADNIGGGGQAFGDARIHQIGDQVERVGVEIITQQNSGRIVKTNVRRGLASARVGVIDQIVMDQRRGVNQFKRRADAVMRRRNLSDRFSDQQHQRWTEHFSVKSPKIGDEFRDLGFVAGQRQLHVFLDLLEMRLEVLQDIKHR